MKSIAKLKERARLHEQEGKWAEAIQLYQQALATDQGGEAEVDFTLFNRIGDLYLRIGERLEAVRYYVQAAEHYEEAGFYNNAIALCNKALRQQPERVALYHKLGRLSAIQGFMTDARRWLLEYAERMLTSGKGGEARRVLGELAHLPVDPEIWEALAERFLAAGEEPPDGVAPAGSDHEFGDESGELPGLGLQSAADSAGIDEIEAEHAPAEAIELEPMIVDGTDTVDLETEAAGEEEIEIEVAFEDGAADDDEVEPLPLLDLPGFAEDALSVPVAEELLPLPTLVDISPAEPSPKSALPGAEFVDLVALVQGEDAEEDTRFVVSAKAPTGDEDQDFLDMLAQFKSKVSEHLDPEDADSHYDLGLAFKEMGLLDEAIAQFQTALHALSGRLKVYEELGSCFMLRGQHTIAAKLLERALHLPDADDAGVVGVCYLLGCCYEVLGRPDDARDAYERVMTMDIQFRDVADRLARL